MQARGNIRPAGTTTKTWSPNIASGIRNPEVPVRLGIIGSVPRLLTLSPSTQIVMSILVQPPLAGTTLKTHLDIPMNSLYDDVSYEKGTMGAYSDNLLSLPPRLSIKTSLSPPPPDASYVPQGSWTLRRRSATADAGRHVEKLADFFGVNDKDVFTLA